MEEVKQQAEADLEFACVPICLSTFFQELLYL